LPGSRCTAPRCQDIDANAELYGSKLNNKEILTGNPTAPSGAHELVSALNRYSPREDKDKPIESRGEADRKKK
jgi:hypothetical protein